MNGNPGPDIADLDLRSHVQILIRNVQYMTMVYRFVYYSKWMAVDWHILGVSGIGIH